MSAFIYIYIDEIEVRDARTPLGGMRPLLDNGSLMVLRFFHGGCTRDISNKNLSE